MKILFGAPAGFVADGHWRYTRSEGFRALERAACLAVEGEFAPKLASAGGWIDRLRLRWQKHCATRRALLALRPSLDSCFWRVTGS